MTISTGGPGLRVFRSLLGALALVPYIALGCGDDSPGPDGSSGSGGGAGTGGSGGSGGTVGGSSGASGASAGGSGGADAGSGGTAGSTGGGGAAGSSGSGGTDGGRPGADAGNGPTPTIVDLSPTGHDRFFGVAHDAAGNIYATGSIASGTDSATDHAMVLAKFLPTGALDTSFGTNGFVTHNVAVGTSGEMARGIVVQSTGKIVISGSVEHAGDPRDRDVALVRFTPQGAIDTTFGTNGVRLLDLSSGEVTTADGGTSIVAESTWGLSVFPNDDLVVSGARKADGRSDTDFALAKLKADGSTDTTFGMGGVVSLDISMANATPKTATILPDGSIVMSGYMNAGGIVTPVLFKVSPTGVLDPSFGVGGVFNQPVLAAVTEAYGAALQGTNLVTNGYGRNTTSESTDFLSLRITAAGTLDTSYGTNGVARIDVAGFTDNGRGVAVLPDDRVLLLGGGRPSSSEVDAMVAVLTPNGQPDTTFGPAGYRLYDLGGPSDFFWSASVAPDKKSVVVVGLKGAATATDAGMAGNDDGAVLILPVAP